MPAPCCICGDRPFTQLHHFGDGGGKALKPSDYQVARVCKTCADRWELKYVALVKNGYWEILSAFQHDALKLHDLWLEHLSEARKVKLHLRCLSCSKLNNGECTALYRHEEPPGDCAIEELSQHIAAGLLEDPTFAVKWLLNWANLRYANVLGWAVGALERVAKNEGSGAEIALDALRVIGIDNEETFNSD
jgi:hypothetical protein